MTHSLAAPWVTTTLLAIVHSAIRILVVGAAAGSGLALFRAKNIRLRLFVWTTALYVALLMPFLGWLLPPVEVATPAFLQPVTAVTLANDASRSSSLMPASHQAVTATHSDSSRAAKRNLLSQSHRPVSATNSVVFVSTPSPALASRLVSLLRSLWSSTPWTAFASVLYFPVAFVLLLRLIVGAVLSQRLRRSAQVICDQSTTRRLGAHARATSLAFVPHVAESDLIAVPVTVGALRSTILLPVGWREWDDTTFDSVIAHEMSHVARHDALTQRLSVLHRAFFWFSPFAWWLDRHLAALAEQASDEAALRCGVDRKHYARTLLGFFQALQTAPGRVWWQGVSMASTGRAEQRLEKILDWRGAVTMGLKKSVVLAIIAFAVPIVYVAASARPANHSRTFSDIERAQEPTPAPSVAPVAPSEMPPPPATAPPTASAPRSGIAVIAPVAAVPAAAAIAATAPLAPVTPAVAWTTQSHGSGRSHGGYSVSFGYDDEQRFVIVTGKSDSLTMSGTSEDARHVERLRKQISGDFIWFQRDEKSYIIRDQATIDRARKFWAPQEELGKKQEELGAKQEALGKQQEELGEKMEQIKVNVPDLTATLDKLKAKLQKLGASATMEQIGDLQSEIGELQSEIGEIQSQAGEQQSKLGDQQGALGEKQGKLGEEQGELGRRQAELAKQATMQMKQLLDESIKNGKAQPEQDGGSGASL